MSYRAAGKALCTACGIPAIARHLCRKHYSAAWAKGEIKAHSRISQDEAFDCRVSKGDGCWFWTGTKNQYGYGVFLLPGERPVRAHRYMYEREKGPIPDGLVVRHTCDTPACINPAHLVLGSKAENNKDAAERHRHNYGLEHWIGKLPDEAVLEIRKSEESAIILASKYGVDQSHISRIKHGKARRFLPTVER